MKRSCRQSRAPPPCRRYEDGSGSPHPSPAGHGATQGIEAVAQAMVFWARPPAPGRRQVDQSHPLGDGRSTAGICGRQTKAAAQPEARPRGCPGPPRVHAAGHRRAGAEAPRREAPAGRRDGPKRAGSDQPGARSAWAPWLKAGPMVAGTVVRLLSPSSRLVWSTWIMYLLR